MAPRHLALLILINVVWGFNFVAAKVGVDEISPLLFTAVRFSLLAVLLSPWLRWPTGQVLPVLGVAMFSGGLHFAIMFTALSLAADVAPVAIATQLTVPFSTILSVIFLHERIGWKRTAGIVLAFGGVMTMGFSPSAFLYVEALGLIVIAAFLFAIGMILMRGLRDVGGLQLQAWLALLSVPVLVPATLLFETDHLAILEAASWQAWGAILYTAIGATIIGHTSMFFLLQRYPVTSIVPMTLLAPVLGAGFGVWLLDDTLNWQMVLGAVITMVGVGIIVLRNAKKKAPPIAVPPGPVT